MDEPRAQLSRELRRLKIESGKSYDSIGKSALASRSSVERYVNGKLIPPPEVLRAFVAHCGGDEQEVARLLELRRRALAEQPATKIQAPAEDGPAVQPPPATIARPPRPGPRPRTLTIIWAFVLAAAMVVFLPGMEPTARLVPLGGLDLNGYCANTGFPAGARHIASGSRFGWECVGSAESKAIDMSEVCRAQYSAQAQAQLGEPASWTSWQCVGPAGFAYGPGLYCAEEPKPSKDIPTWWVEGQEMIRDHLQRIWRRTCIRVSEERGIQAIVQIRCDRHGDPCTLKVNQVILSKGAVVIESKTREPTMTTDPLELGTDWYTECTSATEYQASTTFSLEDGKPLQQNTDLIPILCAPGAARTTALPARWPPRLSSNGSL